MLRNGNHYDYWSPQGWSLAIIKLTRLRSCPWRVWMGSEHLDHHSTGQVPVFGGLRSRTLMSHHALPTPRSLVRPAPAQHNPRAHWLPHLLLPGNPCPSAKDAAELRARMSHLWRSCFPSMCIQGSTQALLSHSLPCSGLSEGYPGSTDPEKPQQPKPGKPHAVYTPLGITWVPRQGSTSVLPGTGLSPPHKPVNDKANGTSHLSLSA